MIAFVDYDLLLLSVNYKRPNYELMKYYSFYNGTGLTKLFTSTIELRTYPGVTKVFIFSNIFGVGKTKLYDEILPRFRAAKIPVIFIGVGFFKVRREMPKEIESQPFTHEVYYDWLRQLVRNNMVGAAFCHNFTRFDTIKLRSNAASVIPKIKTKRSFCNIVDNDFLEYPDALQILEELKKKYTKIKFYEPFQVSKLDSSLSKMLFRSPRIIQNYIELDVPLHKTIDLIDYIKLFPQKRKVLIPVGRMNDVNDVNILREFERIFEWCSFLHQTTIVPHIVIPDSWFSWLNEEQINMYKVLRLWINFDRSFNSLSPYEAARLQSESRKKENILLKKNTGIITYQENSYLDKMIPFIEKNTRFALKFLYKKKIKVIKNKEEHKMTNFEIRKRKEELDAELEQSIIDGINNFKLNEKTQFLMQQVTELQGQCTHQDDAGSTYNKNNICGICGHRITTGGTNGV